ncbi:glycosyltransferase [uncultured Oceanisphaera sp.]|uniref:O-linked N-acetylglucosamine transferase family protein n=1 Tax=uncultured Oceanisphaera sp. TaxID=353858 RepID=UPI0026340D45|nr:glycosyltransferase [uncultured Oceanisphaera sp.]
MSQRQQRTSSRFPTPSRWLDAQLDNARRLLASSEYQKAANLLEQHLNTENHHAELHYLFAQALHGLGKSDEAKKKLETVLASSPEHKAAHKLLATMLFQCSHYQEALQHAEFNLAQAPDDLNALEQKALILSELYRYDEAADIFETLVKQRPDDPSFWNNAGNLWRNLGQLDKAIGYYYKAMECAGADDMTYSNYLTALHYHPEYSSEDIFIAAKEWQQRYATNLVRDSSHTNDKNFSKRLRIGMFSDGFRAHPVGQMITSVLEQLSHHEIELYLYSTNTAQDSITNRIKKTAEQWMSIIHLNDTDFISQIRKDNIDILIDLCGHNSGSRMRTMVHRPAPLLVKWVGGLINTTGVSAIDYLISDNIETPPHTDDFYTEKLIRMPDDYICYNPPLYSPDITPPPAKYIGYITLGCFNNPTKINEVILGQWAKILHSLPNARLFLKGLQFGSDVLRQQTQAFLEQQGIAAYRIQIEGPSPHDMLLKAYNRVDIALDPWPYSGGLTTCEALFMGVPVVTLPGPTFAGRHSATHLTNVGLSQLVAEDWEQYHDIVVNLASDLDNLANIRTHLRSALLESPVCDAPRFARNFSNAIRAIWQRHCEGKTPAALTLDTEGNPQFKDDAEPVIIQLPALSQEETKTNGFHFSFNGKIITLDNGGTLSSSVKFAGLHKLGALATICLDPGNRIANAQQLQYTGEFHHYPMTILGDGDTATLYVTLDSINTGTLPPLPTELIPESLSAGCELLTELPINTLRLDSIEGLGQLEWLVLDNMHNIHSILEHGAKSLVQPLIIQIRVNFIESHQEQPELNVCRQRMAELGYHFHRLTNKQCVNADSNGDSDLLFADAVFVPSENRLSNFDHNQRLKLAFLLHAVYQSFNFAYVLLKGADQQLAEDYLNSLSPEEKMTSDLINRDNDESPLQQTTKNDNSPQHNDEPELSIVKVLKAGRYPHAHSQVCVGVPIYNEADYLTETLTSLKRQNLDDVHFLIIDNASTDNSIALCLELIGDDPRFTLLQQHQNLGANENFKAALNLSRSQYFMWLGGHDFISDDYLGSAVSVLEQHPQVAMVLGQPYAMLNDKCLGLVKEAIYDFSDGNPLVRYLRSVQQLTNCTIVHSLFRRNALDGYEMRQTISADHVLISHLLWHGRIHYLDNARYYRRYFEQRDSTQSERLSGNKSYLSRYEFYRFYLDNFSQLYRGDSRMERFVENKILSLLEQRFGAQGLLENDGLHLH